MKKHKDIVIGIAFVLLLAGGLTWISARGIPPKREAAAVSSGFTALAAAEDSFDFGTVSMAAGKVSHSFRIKNADAKPVVIDKMYTSCMCTTASLMTGGKQFGPYGMPGHGFVPRINEPLDPDEEASVEVVFDPAAHGPAGVGPIERVVYIETPGGTRELKIKAVVTP